MYIYRITNRINGKIYIGQTTRTLQQRWIEHCKPSSTKCVLLHNAIQKYGKENFTIEKIDMACDLEELNKKEIYWIKYYDSANSDKGYNLSLGGGVMNINKSSLCLCLKGKNKTAGGYHWEYADNL